MACLVLVYDDIPPETSRAARSTIIGHPPRGIFGNRCSLVGVHYGTRKFARVTQPTVCAKTALTCHRFFNEPETRDYIIIKKFKNWILKKIWICLILEILMNFAFLSQVTLKENILKKGHAESKMNLWHFASHYKKNFWDISRLFFYTWINTAIITESNWKWWDFFQAKYDDINKKFCEKLHLFK